MRELPSRGRSSLAETDSATNGPASSIFQTTPPSPGGQGTPRDPLVRVFPRNNPYGWPLSALALSRRVTAPDRGEVVSLREALTRAWDRDAHTVPYAGDDGPHGAIRLANKVWAQGVAPQCVLLALDVDDPEAHARRGAAAAPARAALAERVDGHALDEVLEALVQGQDRSKDTVGYARALRAVTLARPELAPHLAPLRRDKRLREVLATPREAMEARWATTALAHLDEIPTRAR